MWSYSGINKYNILLYDMINNIFFKYDGVIINMVIISEVDIQLNI